MTVFVDPRVRMRTALHRLVQQEPTQWHEPSMLVFRNRLLDETGSDARPLAELLVEAIQRGWRDRLPADRMDATRWDALSAPFVMQWSAERFVQLEMAQWAAESWAFAFGVIAPEQLRIAPLVSPARAEQRSRAAAVPATLPAAAPARSARGARTPTKAARPALSLGGAATPHARGLQFRAPVRPSSAPSRIPPLSPRIAKGIAIAAGLSYLGFIARISWAVRSNRRTTPVSATAVAATAAVPNAVAASPRPAPSPAPATDLATTATAAPASIPATTPMTAPATEPATVPSGSGPGVPSVTRNLLDSRVVDPARMLYVEPARRAVGNSRPVAPPATPGASTSPAATAYDEVFLNDGSSMRGRVDVVRAGVVVFQDRRTGLRHEIRKDDIDRIVTEFGAPVRFRVADNVAAATNGAVMAARARADNGPRGRGVAGVYDVRYGTANAVGSKACTDLWKKPQNTSDVATVRHAPGADTLRVAFAGGDTFLSNMDADGFFASTFRIVPDQARTSTALTTRLTGQFKTDGTLALQVIIVFYRRMRAGDDVTCTVNVNAVGQRRSS